MTVAPASSTSRSWLGFFSSRHGNMLDFVRVRKTGNGLKKAFLFINYVA